MFKNRLGVRSVVALLIFTLVVSAFGFVGAQDNSAAPFIGIGITSADNGVKVDQVEAGSPAEKAGIKVDDVITAIDTKAVTSDTIGSVITGHKVGDVITVSLTRGTDKMDVKVTLAARPATAAQAPAAPSATRPVLGIQIENTNNGPTVRVVATGSPAEKAGLKVGDVLTKIGDTAVTDAQSASAAVQTHKVGDDVAIEVTRDGKTVTVNATLAAAPMTLNTNPMQSGNGMSITVDGNDKSWTITGLAEDNDLYKAGLRDGDKLTKFDGTAYDPIGLMAYLMKDTAADVTVTVTRDGKDQEIKVPVEALKGLGMGSFGMNFGNEPFFNVPFDMMGGGSRLGVQFVMLDPSVAKEHNVTETVGALVTQVMPQSPAEKAGLKINDVVTAVNGDTVNGEHNLRDLLTAHAPGDSIKLDVMRDGKSTQLDVTLDQMPTSGIFQFPNGGDANGSPFQIPTPEPASPLNNGSAM